MSLSYLFIVYPLELCLWMVRHKPKELQNELIDMSTSMSISIKKEPFLTPIKVLLMVLPKHTATKKTR